MSRKIIIDWILIPLLVICVDCHQNQEKDVSNRVGRQLSLWPFSSLSVSPALSRQIFDVLDIVTDVAMVTILGLPILGLVALGASMMAPSIVSSSSGGRNKRSSDEILDRSRRAILYCRNLFDVLANLEETFKKYEIMESECQLKAVCEVHKKNFVVNHRHESFSDQITNLIRMEKDLEEYEIIPLARIIFSQYADAATYGNEDNDCDLIYSRCGHSVKDLLNQTKNPPKDDWIDHHGHDHHH